MFRKQRSNGSGDFYSIMRVTLGRTINVNLRVAMGICTCVRVVVISTFNSDGKEPPLVVRSCCFSCYISSTGVKREGRIGGRVDRSRSAMSPRGSP